MTQFREGQDVEVRKRDPYPYAHPWRKAKIVMGTLPDTYLVQFQDCTRAVFDAGHIRAPRTGCVTTAAGEKKFL
jgi:hypothetical protein